MPTRAGSSGCACAGQGPRQRDPVMASGRPAAGRLAAAAGCGVLAAAGQAPLGLWPVALVGLAGLLALLAAAPGWRAAAWFGWLGGAGHFAAALFWIVEPFLVDPARHGWMAPFALLGMGLGLALFWAAAAALGHVLARGPAGRAVASAVALAAVELARGHVLTGFPWAQPGHVWLETPVAQLAAVTGASGLTALTLLAAALPAAAVARGLWPGMLAGAAGLALGMGAVWGAARLAVPAPVAERPVMLRLVQPNAPQHLKWRRDLVRVFFERQLDLTAAPAATPPDLIVWSETAIPWLLEEAGPALRLIAEAAGGAPVALGVQRLEGGRFLNALAVLEGGVPVAVYDKHHLVPFGEYVPFADLLASVPLPGLAGQALAGYSPGPGPALLDLGALGRVRPLICYEAIFPAYPGAPERPDWVLQVTNDAWFGRAAGPQQHLAQARLRAIEQGLPVARAANTGISAVIDPLGRPVAMLGLGRAGVVDAALPGALQPTVFARTGEVPLALLLLVALAVGATARLRGGRQRISGAIDAAGGRG